MKNLGKTTGMYIRSTRNIATGRRRKEYLKQVTKYICFARQRSLAGAKSLGNFGEVLTKLWRRFLIKITGL
jgi:hypothetical protein